jgi:glycosyltransferase involved in cell wall biosynthesis
MRPTDAPELRAQLGLGDRPVVLCPGARRPHKNAVAVLEALALLNPAERPIAVVTGYATSYDDELRTRAAALGLTDDLVLPAWLAPAALEGLYALAGVVAVPSRYEGFGLPVLEAMLRGVPVVSSNCASLPEVAGGAAILVDPDDHRALADALRRVLTDPAEAQRLSAAGRVRAGEFAWERTAELTAASYRRALEPRA